MREVNQDTTMEMTACRAAAAAAAETVE